MSAWDDRPGRDGPDHGYHDGYDHRHEDGGGRAVSGEAEDSGVAEFAQLLTELKERTERSYGSLARRLGMNTSTLHRYCAGEAVPQDFAPVERLAEFCGATPEERLELHRRWLRATAVRQVRQARRQRAANGGAGMGTEAEPAPAPAGIVTETGAPDEAPGAPPPPPRSRYRRRPRRAVLLGVACALFATLGTLSALPGGGAGSQASGDTPADGGATSAPPSRPAHSTLPAAPRPASDAPPTSIAPTALRPKGSTPAPLVSAAPGASGRPGTKSSAAPAEPLAWTADSQLWAQGCGHDYVIDKPPARVPPPPAEQDAAPWATAQGAVHGRETNVEISVQGRSSTAVVLTALRVWVVGRAEPKQGNDYAMDQGCGGSLSKRYFAVDLDKDRPIAHSVAGNDSGTVIPAVRLPYRVSAEDPEVLLVTARTETCDCSWYLELDWSSQGRTGTVRVDDHGRPFRTSGINGLPRYWYGTGDSGRAWIPYT